MMARSDEDFSKAWSDLQAFVKRHDKPVWLVPTENSYELSVVEPMADTLPIGTSSNLYDPNLEVMEFVVSSKKH
jgi:hypothetical protein